MLLLIFVFALTASAQDDFRPSPKDLRWGTAANGLRMALWTNAKAEGKIFGIVRNFARQKLCYCQPQNKFFPLIYARPNAKEKWQEINYKNPSTPVVVTSICIIRELKPAQDLPFGSDGNQPKSFALDLREYDFPADWRGKTIEIKLAQPLVYGDCDTNYLSGEVESMPVRIKLPSPDDSREERVIREFFDESNNALGCSDADAPSF